MEFLCKFFLKLKTANVEVAPSGRIQSGIHKRKIKQERRVIFYCILALRNLGLLTLKSFRSTPQKGRFRTHFMFSSLYMSLTK